MKIFLIGMMGSGKSFISKHLALELKLDSFDLDEVIEKAEKETITNIFKEKGEEHFRQLETDYLYQFANKDNFVLATGGGTPCYNNNMNWMNENGITVWLDESIDIITKRLESGKEHRPLIAKLSNDEFKRFVENKLKERKPFYNKAKLNYNSTMPLQNLIGNILHY